MFKMNDALFQHYQSQIKADFDKTRAKFQHAGNKGNVNEAILRTFLIDLLASKWELGHGEIIDPQNNKSDQIDIVVYDDTLQPFISKDKSEPNIFIVEAVSCTGEVKTTLNSLTDSFKKCASVKKLIQKPTAGEMRFGNDSADMKIFYDKKPFFIFAYESNLAIDTIIQQLNEEYADKDITRQIDAVFLLDRGAIINFGDGKGFLQYIDSKTGQTSTGLILVSDQTAVTWSLVTWITAVMKRKILFNNPLTNYLL